MMSRPKKTNDNGVLPSRDYWREIRIDSDKVLEQMHEDDALSSAGAFLPDDIRHLFDKQTGGKSAGIPKEDLVNLMRRREPALLNTLFLLSQYSRWVSKKALREAAADSGLQTGRRNKIQLTLLLFNEAPGRLRQVRIVSIGHRIQTNYAFTASSKQTKAKSIDKSAVRGISEQVEQELSTLNKRARLVEHYSEPGSDSHKLFIKYEDRTERVEEWEDSHWDKPIDWVIAEYNSRERFLTVRCKDERRAKGVASILSTQLTGKPDSFTQIDFSGLTSTPDRSPKELSGIKGLKVFGIQVKSLTLENVRARHSPTVALKSSDVIETIDDLVSKYRFNPMKDAAISAYDIAVEYEYQGIANETTVKLTRGKSGIVVSSVIPDLVKKGLIESISASLGAK